jgi:D-psicose/D-tagatose/L-ribulose 3-epimerase
MRFGCCSNMVAKGADGTGIEIIEKMAEYGFDYIELPLAQMTAFSDEQFAALKERVNNSKIRCETCNNLFPANIKLTGPAVDQKRIEAYYRSALKRAGELGVEFVVFGSGPAKNVPEGFPMEEGYQQVLNLLQEIALVARENNITIAIEPLRKIECNLINTFKEGCQLAKDVGSPHVRVLVDYYHLTQEQEPVQNILDLGKEYLVHAHFARNEGRVYPETMEEDRAYQPFIDALQAIGYEGRVSCEAYVEDFDRQAKQAILFFKDNFK